MRTDPIKSSDSDAIPQLSEKLAKLEADRDKMKAVNAAWRKHLKGDDSALVALGYTAQQIGDLALKIAAAYSWEKAPYVGWQLTNLGATIRSVKERINNLSAIKAQPEVEIESTNGSGIRYEDSPQDNRVRLFFPGKPDEATRSKLKSNGFRWTPTLGCWQAYRNYRAEMLARSFIAPKTVTVQEIDPSNGRLFNEEISNPAAAQDHSEQTAKNNVLMLDMDREREARRIAALGDCKCGVAFVDPNCEHHGAHEYHGKPAETGVSA